MRRTGMTLKVRAVVTCVTLLVLLVGTAGVFGMLIQQREVHGRLINISGRQRMLSQRIALMSSWIASDPSDDRVRASLGESIDMMAHAHAILTRGEDNPTPLTPGLRAHYFDDPDPLDRKVERFLKYAWRVHGRKDVDHEVTRSVVSMAEEELLTELDRAVALYERDSVSSLQDLTKAFYGLLVVSLVVLSIVGFYVILPLIREVGARVRELERAASQIVDRNVVLEERVATRTAELEDALSQRTQLLKELHHRVKNNLQIVSSLIRLQAAKAKHEDARDALAVTQHRIDTLARLHCTLHDGEDMTGLDLGAYLGELVPAIVAGLGPEGVEVDLDMASVLVPPDTATPCGLLLNELVTNAIKYGRGEDGRLRLSVSLHEQSDELELVVADEGAGFGAEVHEGGSSLGLQLVRNLGAQLEGILEFDASRGASVSLRFPRPLVPLLTEESA